MKHNVVVLSLAAASFVAAQTRTSISISETERLSDIATATAAPAGEPCAAVASALSSSAAIRDPPYVVRASFANACQRSVPIVKEDALRLIDGILAGLEFQSDVGHLASPPEGYLLAGVDLFAEINDIRRQVDSDEFTNEIDFQRNMSAVFGKAQDGHLDFNFDGLVVFQYQRLLDGLISVSADGTSLPEIFFLTEWIEAQGGSGDAPSPVSRINGVDVVDFLQQQGQNVSFGLYQDPDSLYNNMFYQLNSGQPGQDTLGAFTYSIGAYIGDETVVTYANGSEIRRVNAAVWNPNYSFEGLEDGPSFYNLFCNATAKEIYYFGEVPSQGVKRMDKVELHEKKIIKRQIQREIKREVKRQDTETISFSRISSTRGSVQPSVTAIPGYPLPVAIADDLSLSGYFLEEDGFEDTAVLVLAAMSEADPESFQATLTSFMDQCRAEGKTRLVLDVQGNPGGTIALGYEVFKQLFPDLHPYAAGTLRAQEGLNVLGQFYTNFTSQLYAEQPDNLTLLLGNNYYFQYSAEAFASSDGELFETWDQLYGPVDAGPDYFTNLIRLNFNDTNTNLAYSGGIVISGLGNSTDLQPSPFSSENIIILSNGQCASTCTILSHLLKYQGKVKSIAMGGLPRTGPMQAVGGVKGSQVYQYYQLSVDVLYGYQTASLLGYADFANAIETNSITGNILSDGDYVVLRGANAGVNEEALNDFTFNWQNNIAEGDETYTPTQFVYEAADCRLWYQPQHILDVENLWMTTASQAFGLNGTDVFSLCVEGSTNDPSSLSGNAELFNDGQPNNVTEFLPEQQNEGGGSRGDEDAAGRISISLMATIVAIAATLFAL